MAICYSAAEQFELREILLKDKPESMLHCSPKGTVPVAVVGNMVIEESLELMLWVIAKNDPERWLNDLDRSLMLIDRSDSEFKYWLDRYKYQVGYPEYSQEHYRGKAIDFLVEIESLLSKHRFLLDQVPRLADVAIFPFVRQFAFVDKAWFDQSEYKRTRQWLDYWLADASFEKIMTKRSVWRSNDTPVYFPGAAN